MKMADFIVILFLLSDGGEILIWDLMHFWEIFVLLRQGMT
jgi:hypothetical protein